MTDADAIDTLEEVTDLLDRVRSEIAKRIVGQRDVVDQLLICLLADGNALLESNPGLGKTLLVRTIADISRLEFSRIQNTPDLMPSDVIGTEIVRETAEGQSFVFEKGPVFANIVLADEINRATPKTQSALLEAMQERQVTTAGTTYDLPKPFFLLATENPIEMEGSLHPDESLYMNGRLYRAGDALDFAKVEGELVHEAMGTSVYDVGATTSTLTPDGELVETDCLVYEIEHEGSVYSIETKTGRRIRVTGNHPFLVNRDGVLQWVEARELTDNDFLVQPRRHDPPSEAFSDHSSVMDTLESKDEFDVVRRNRVQELLEIDDLSTDHRAIDDLRIAAGLSKKDLANRAELSYDRVLNFLSGTENGLGEELQTALDNQSIVPSDYIESFRTHRIDTGLSDADAGFFVGFLLAEGHVGNTVISVSQKNLPGLLDRWIDIAEGLGLSIHLRERESGRVATINSKPFVAYLKERYHIDEPERYLSAPEPFKREFLQAFVLTESHFDEDRNRITLRQKDRTMVNILANLFLAFDIIPWIYDRSRIFDIRIQGSDIETYLQEFEWPGDPPDHQPEDSVHRTIPVPEESVSSLVDILGMKYEFQLSSRPWYNSYHTLRAGLNQMSTPYFERFLWDVDGLLNRRRAMRIEAVAEDDLGVAAKQCGLSMTDVAEGADVDKNLVWQSYSSDRRPPEIIDYVTSEFRRRLSEAEALSEHLHGMIEQDFFYDRVTSIQSVQYDGPVVGLSVPEHHNYLAGLGACGINHNTYTLPEAQTDRFMMKVLVDYPSFDDEREIVDRYTTTLQDAPPVDRVIDAQRLIEIQELVRQVPIADDLKDEAVSLVQRSRDHDDIDFGASPRASMGLVLTAKARALLEGRTHVSEDDLEAMAPPVLRHRLILDFQAERAGKTPDSVITDLV